MAESVPGGDENIGMAITACQPALVAAPCTTHGGISSQQSTPAYTGTEHMVYSRCVLLGSMDMFAIIGLECGSQVCDEGFISFWAAHDVNSMK